MATAAPSVPSPAQLAAVRRASADVVRTTPVLTSASVSARVGGEVVLKAECLQRTGSFKLRGALAKLRALPDPARGVVAGSAGNHAQALAYAARARGVPCEVYMPFDAPLSKLAAVEAFGATVHQEDETVDGSVALAHARAAATGMALVHPFDDLDVIAGQAGVGLELLEQVPDLVRVLVPLGGGGLTSGIALAIKQARPEVEVVGVQARACAPFAAALAGREETPALPGQTIADGIAVKRPGTITLPLVRDWVDAVVTVDEPSIAEAMVLALERSKLVVEGAGAAGLAALLAGVVDVDGRPGATAVVLSGGNVDVGRLAQLAARHETRARRRARVFVRLPDRPGSLAGVLASTAASRVNVITVEHVRDGVELDVRETGVVLTVETQGPDHADRVVGDLRAAGHAAALDDWPVTRLDL